MPNELEATKTTAIALTPPVADQMSLAVSLARAEVDQQIATARALPRSISRAVQNITELATLDEYAAKECIYAVPRGGKKIRGASIRMAEIIASQWGNCRVASRVCHVDRFEKYVEAEGLFHDLESNTATTARVRRRISDSEGRILSEDMIIITGNAAQSIAKRNAILSGVPRGVWRKAYDEVESVIAGDIKTLAERRERVSKTFAAFGVTQDRLFAALGVAGMEDIDTDHMVTLTGMYSALKNGEANVEEMFQKEKPVASGNGPPKSSTERTKTRLDALAAKSRGVDEAAPSHDPVTGEILSKDEARHPMMPPNMPFPQPGADEGEERLAEVLARRKANPSVYGIMDGGEDAKLLKALLDARNKAREGTGRLTQWLQKLSAPDYSRLEPHLAELRQLADGVDKMRKAGR